MQDVIFTCEGGSGSSIITHRTTEKYVFKNDVIIKYRPETADPKSAPLKLIAPVGGEILCKPGTECEDRLVDGMVVCTLTPCTHQTVLKGTCVKCMEEVTEGEYIPTKHSMPALRVNQQTAISDGKSRQSSCLSNRKLVLLVDLDQTIIHTTNRPHTDENLDIKQFDLKGGDSYWTKLRPHTTTFSEVKLAGNRYRKKMSELYEMDIITFGERKYAHAIAKIIDPDKKIFGDRILSRDEAFSQHHKTKNLSVRPYKYFPDVDDINAPTSTRNTILRMIHEAFYQNFDNTGEIGDLKVIMRSLREQTLQGCVIVLSGISLKGSKPRHIPDAYRVVLILGGRVEEEVKEGTTHVVAARWRTQKVDAAIRGGVPVVSPEWLYASLEMWEKAPENPYLLTADSSDPIGPPLGSQMVSEMAILPRESLSDSSKDSEKMNRSGDKRNLGRKEGEENEKSMGDGGNEESKRRRREEIKESSEEEEDLDAEAAELERLLTQ